MFMHLNINSYRHKFVYVSDLLNKKSIDYLAISETKLDDSFPKSQFMVEGYSLYRQDLTSSSGGLIVYVRDDLPHRRMAHVEINRDGFESLCLEITIGHDDFVYLGDMNCCQNKSHAIENICEQYDLTNLIKEPTCHKGSTPSLLDVILVSNTRRYASTFNVFCGLSDFHNIIGAATKRFAPSQKPRIIHYRSFKKFAEPEFLYDIACAPFHVM